MLVSALHHSSAAGIKGGVFQKETGILYNKMLFYDDEDRNVHRVRVSSIIIMTACAWQA